MDYSELGVEGCVNGVWGRVKNGYFYNLVEEGTNCLMREIDVSTEYGNHFAIMCHHDYEQLVYRAPHQPILKAYVPEHSRALGNIKKGDLVWAQTISNDWIPAMYEGYCIYTGKYMCVLSIYCVHGIVTADDELFKAISQTCPLLDSK